MESRLLNQFLSFLIRNVVSSDMQLKLCKVAHPSWEKRRSFIREDLAVRAKKAFARSRIGTDREEMEGNLDEPWGSSHEHLVVLHWGKETLVNLARVGRFLLG
jgi:hypothetical protein